MRKRIRAVTKDSRHALEFDAYPSSRAFGHLQDEEKPWNECKALTRRASKVLASLLPGSGGPAELQEGFGKHRYAERIVEAGNARGLA